MDNWMDGDGWRDGGTTWVRSQQNIEWMGVVASSWWTGNFPFLRIVFPVGISPTALHHSYNTSLPALFPPNKVLTHHSEQKAPAHGYHRQCHRWSSSSFGLQEEEVPRGEVPGKETNTVPFPFQKLTCNGGVNRDAVRHEEMYWQANVKSARGGGRRRKQGAPEKRNAGRSCGGSLGEEWGGGEIRRGRAGRRGRVEVLGRLLCFPSSRRQRNRMWEKDSGPVVQTNSLSWILSSQSASLHNSRENQRIAKIRLS